VPITAAALTIIGARLIDGTGAAPVVDAVIRVDEQGELIFAGPAEHAPPPDPAVPVIDAAGRTVLPGFVDCHTHLGIGAAGELSRRFAADPTVETFRTAERLRSTLRAGITTARDLGGLSAGFRDAVAVGLVEGPRLQVALRILGHTGGHADFTTASGVDLSGGLGDIVDTADQVRVAVRRLLRDGADVVKLCATGGMGSPHDQPEDEDLTENEIRTVVDEVRRHGGRPVAAHAQGTAGILNAVRAGVTSIEHGYGLDDRACELAGERGVFVVPTLSTVFDGVNAATMAPYHYEKKTRWSGITKENIARAIGHGLRIALGTDAGISPHGRNLRELTHLVSLGMSPMDAIVAGTRTAAELLGLTDRIGTVQAGKDADLVVCDGDPLADITALADPDNIAYVVQRGVIRKQPRRPGH
jgi:imidazolonepropionase-like amidohydrolase